MRRAPPLLAWGCVRGTPHGQRLGAGEAVLRKAVCGRGQLPAGVILRCAAASWGLLAPGWAQSVQAQVAQRCLCPQGMAGGFVRRLRKLYWPCWLARRSSGGCPGSPPAAGELICHLPHTASGSAWLPPARAPCQFGTGKPAARCSPWP